MPTINNKMQVVYSREEFTQYLMERLDDVSDIGRYIGFIERAFFIQNDIGRPAYIFEIDIDKADPESFRYMQDVMKTLDVCACLVPTHFIQLAGTVTPESMGVSNVRTMLNGTSINEENEDGGQTDGAGADDNGTTDDERGSEPEGYVPSGEEGDADLGNHKRGFWRRFHRGQHSKK